MRLQIVLRYIVDRSNDRLSMTRRHSLVGRYPMCSGCLVRELAQARLAQSVERKALNLVVVGSSPTVGVIHAHGDDDTT